MKHFLAAILFITCSFNALADNVVYETGWISSDEMEEILHQMEGNCLFPRNIYGRVNDIII